MPTPQPRYLLVETDSSFCQACGALLIGLLVHDDRRGLPQFWFCRSCGQVSQIGVGRIRASQEVQYYELRVPPDVCVNIILDDEQPIETFQIINHTGGRSFNGSLPEPEKLRENGSDHSTGRDERFDALLGNGGS